MLSILPERKDFHEGHSKTKKKTKTNPPKKHKQNKKKSTKKKALVQIYLFLKLLSSSSTPFPLKKQNKQITKLLNKTFYLVMNKQLKIPGHDSLHKQCIFLHTFCLSMYAQYCPYSSLHLSAP